MTELRRYEPTARRLQKLRQAGAAPHSATVSGVAVLLGAVLLGLLGGRGLLHVLGGVLAQDLQQGMVAPAELSALLWRHLLVAGLLLALLASAFAACALVAAAGQGALTPRPPWRGLRERQRQGLDAPATALALVGLGGSLVLFLPLLWHYLHAAGWRELADPRLLLTICWRQLSLLAGLAVLHLLYTRARHLQKAMLTYSELQQERKESEGSWLKARRRLVARAQQQRRPHSD